MMPRSTPDQRLASRTPAHPCVQAPPTGHLITLFYPYTVLDKRAMTYNLTCLHHHRCRFMTLDHRNGSPNLIEYP
jgi:hypothetical protein